MVLQFFLSPLFHVLIPNFLFFFYKNNFIRDKGNPLSCSCGMLWLRGWLQQASSEGPRCADGSLFKEIRLARQDCQRERQIDPIHPGCEAEMIDIAPYPVSSSSE